MKTEKPKNKTISFIIYGDARPKARARTVRTKKGVRSYTPKPTAEWEASIYGQALKYRPEVPYDGPVALGVVCFKTVPKSWSQKKTDQALAGIIRPAGARDDLDNLIKSIQDGLKDLYWLNDGQVVEYRKCAGLPTGKYYGLIPCVMITIEFLEKNDINLKLNKIFKYLKSLVNNDVVE